AGVVLDEPTDAARRGLRAGELRIDASEQQEAQRARQHAGDAARGEATNDHQPSRPSRPSGIRGRDLIQAMQSCQHCCCSAAATAAKNALSSTVAMPFGFGSALQTAITIWSRGLTCRCWPKMPRASKLPSIRVPAAFGIGQNM